MAEQYSHYIENLNINLPSSIQVIKEVEKELKVDFPLEYVNFLLVSNGVTGIVGTSYVDFWAIEEIVQDNEDYEVNEYAPGLILFGSDGGGCAYAFDSRYSSMPLVKVPFIGMDLDEVIKLGDSFIEFLDYLYKLE